MYILYIAIDMPFEKVFTDFLLCIEREHTFFLFHIEATRFFVITSYLLITYSCVVFIFSASFFSVCNDSTINLQIQEQHTELNTQKGLALMLRCTL